MGFRFRKTKKIGPFSFTLSKSGISASVGVPGLRVTKTAAGNVRTTASIPGTGISYSKEVKGKETAPTSGVKQDQHATASASLPRRELPEPTVENVARFISETGKTDVGDIQREFCIGYSRAARLLDEINFSQPCKESFVTSVAGVTFDNEDGTSRQKILKKIHELGDTADLGLEDYEYNGNPAIRVLVNGQCIGSIPSDRVTELLSIMDRLEDARIKVNDYYSKERHKTIYRAELTLIYPKDAEE